MSEHGVRAFVVGDIEKERPGLLRLLNGYADTVATSVHEALAELDRGAVDLIVVSCATGQRAASELIAALKGRPYILISCQDDGHHLVSASNGEPVGRFHEPLAAVVSELIERARVEQEVVALTVARHHEAFVTVNSEHKVEGVSAAAERMFQYAAQEVIGRGAEFLLPLWPPGPNLTAMPCQTIGMRKDGSRFPMELSVDEMLWGGRRSIMVTLRDLTPRPDHLAPVEELATRDELTGLFNQKSLAFLLGEAIKRSDQYPSNVGLLMVEVDHLSLVNEMHGRQRADEVLSAAAKIIAGELREVDRVIRYGGDEIIVILHETSERKALATAERIRRSVNHLPFTVSHGTHQVPIRMSVSVGTAFYPADGETTQQLLQAATEALQEAKRLGCDRVVSFSSINAPTAGSSGGI